MSNVCPYIEECESKVTEKFCRRFCLVDKEPIPWESCYKYRERVPSMRPKEWYTKITG